MSRSIDLPTFFAAAGLLSVTLTAFIIRRDWPLSSYGWLIFLLFLSPTSSFVPLQDAYAEHRLYLAIIGLLLIVVEVISKWNVNLTAMVAAICILFVCESLVTYRRNLLWSDAILLWQDTVKKSPAKVRPRFQLAYALYASGRCD